MILLWWIQPVEDMGLGPICQEPCKSSALTLSIPLIKNQNLASFSLQAAQTLNSISSGAPNLTASSDNSKITRETARSPSQQNLNSHSLVIAL